MLDTSIIIRTKNEERWIAHCLRMLYKQDYQDFEVILVDNESTDYTVEAAKRYPLAAVVTIDEFRPGKALNDGIRASSGRFIVCLSAHCIPEDTRWLSNLRRNFDGDAKVAGVYGRQLPVSFTEAIDKRDLLIVFGRDRRVQVKDYFFHNANSMLRRDVWERFPFDESVTNIEDRVWGKVVTEAGYHLVYDPEAAVFHHHGLHQNNAPERAKGVVSIIEQVDEGVVNELPESLRPEYANILAVLPVQGSVSETSLEYQILADAVERLRASRYVNNVYLVSSDEELALRFGVHWINRAKLLDAEQVSVEELLREALWAIEERHDYPDAILYVNRHYPFRPDGLFDDLILDAQYKGCDTVFPAFVDYGHYWQRYTSEQFTQIDPSMKSRAEREPIMRALYGLGCVISTSVIRSGKMVGGKVGILPVDDLRYTLNLRELGAETVLETLLEHRVGIGGTNDET